MKTALEIHREDQNLAEVRNDAALAARYYTTLRLEGIEPGEALQMTLRWITSREATK